MSRRSRVLRITNGEAAVGLMKRAGLAGDFLSWDDPLHEGPLRRAFPRQILAAVDQGHHNPHALFRASQSMEQARFLGDWSFWLRLEALSDGPHPLLAPSRGPFGAGTWKVT